ncbi:MAG TPA: DUF2076 domain-containing protein [Roseiarcus sp.]|nr:DUF2076 domain-containing protein [Roseiarcus sp.]
MTPEERQLLAGLFQRVASTASTPRDGEAEAFIADAVRLQPHAPYVLAQTVLVQQQALEAAAKRVQELEAQAQNPPQETSFLGNLGKSLFGGGAAPAPARSAYDAGGYARQPGPPPQQQPYASQPYPTQQQSYSPGPWGAAAPSSGGFLQNALTTAAGVAGGVMVADSLRNLFGGHAGLGGFGSGGYGGGETVVNNYYDNADPAGQHAQDVLQDMDQDQDDAQDAGDNQNFADDSGGSGDDGGNFDA